MVSSTFNSDCVSDTLNLSWLLTMIRTITVAECTTLTRSPRVDGTIVGHTDGVLITTSYLNDFLAV